jgi:hypothetical protein
MSFLAVQNAKKMQGGILRQFLVKLWKIGWEEHQLSPE